MKLHLYCFVLFYYITTAIVDNLLNTRRENFLTMEEDLTPNIELRFLNYRLKILSVKKTSIHKLMYPLAKIAFTKKTECSFFSFDETNDDFSIVVDLFGYEGMYFSAAVLFWRCQAN